MLRPSPTRLSSLTSSVSEFVQQYVDWLQALPPGWIYAVLFATAFLENVLPPFPGDISAVVAGYLGGLGLIGLVPTIFSISTGSVCGFMVMYAVGLRLGDAVEDPQRLRWIPRGPVAKGRRWLRRWGYGLVLANRFLSGTRAVVTLLAGASRLRAGLTAVCAAVSALVWTTLLVYAGRAVGANWGTILPWLRRYGQVVTAIVLVAVVVLVMQRLSRRRYQRSKRAGGTTHERGQRNREDLSS